MLKIKTVIKHKIELEPETLQIFTDKQTNWINALLDDTTELEYLKDLYNQYNSYLNRIIKAAFDKGYELGQEENQNGK